MQDVAYVLATIAFFAAMAWFVIGCERIVGDDDANAVPGGERPAAQDAAIDEGVVA